MGSPANPPDSPPAQPVIPEGLATKLGKYGALVTAVLAAAAGIFDVELNTETLAAFGGSLLLLVTTMAGRFAQAAALYRDSPKDVLETLVDYADNFEDTIEDKSPPTEEELKQDFPEDAPEDEVTSSALGVNKGVGE
jgi:hypothetical protein